MLKPGQLYKRLNKDGKEMLFPFGYPVAIFIEIVPSGFLRFALGNKKECIINPEVSDFREAK